MCKGPWFSLAMCLTLGSYGQVVVPPPNGRIVLVPALVESKSGKVVYGLTADDFSIKDDGIEQRIILEADADIQPISLGKSELIGKIRSLNPLGMVTGSVQKNPGIALAQLTGGDFFRFNDERDFETRVGDVANHIHNRYNLAFQPRNPRPGLHSLQIEVRQSKANIVSAREAYWVSTTPDSESGGGSE